MASKKKKINPTFRQKRAVAILVEKGGSVSAAMREAGYTDKTAKTPQKLTESAGFEALLDTYLPDKKLLAIHKEGLNATTKRPHLVDRDDKGRPIYEYVPEKDYAVRHRYLDTAYKLKGKINKADPASLPPIGISINGIRAKYA